MRVLFIVSLLLCFGNDTCCQERINFILEINKNYVFGGDIGRFQIYPEFNQKGSDTIEVDYILGELHLKYDDFKILDKISSDSMVVIDFDFYKSSDGPSEKFRYCIKLKKEFLTQRYLVVKLYDRFDKGKSCCEHEYEYVSPLGVGLLPKDRKKIKRKYRRK